MKKNLPLILAGPILRKITQFEVNIWIVTTADIEIRLNFYPKTDAEQKYELSRSSDFVSYINLSPKLTYVMINLTLSRPLPINEIIKYEISARENNDTSSWQNLTEHSPYLLYPGQEKLQFCIPERINSLLHGSCRKPHHPGNDGLVIADNYLKSVIASADIKNTDSWPSMLVMSGDQIYADDVSGPMLHAIHQLIDKLSFPSEQWDNLDNEESICTSEQLYNHHHSYYRRSKILPYSNKNEGLVKVLFGGAKKPILTSINAENHLITLAEYLSCYLLSWSPVPWSLVTLDMPDSLDVSSQRLYTNEKKIINQFVEGLTDVQRVMAHLPIAMILDDHDITDDFNLHRHWEETVYSHPLSHRMIGNGMLAYLINQAWGNKPEGFRNLFNNFNDVLENPSVAEYDNFLGSLIKLEAWDFDWNTNPPLIVLDTRTRRWRSENSPTKPSGLLDWEALTELQQRLSGHQSALLVSAAPIFGVKLIEVIQKIVTSIGYPLAVDAEYWMAHPGTAHGILNVFRHRKTPHNFVILSGDVHYSFAYDVELRGQKDSPHIWQICSSGLRNTFPEPLLSILDTLNRWLYSPKSPLNWFTRRRNMRITPRKLSTHPSGKRLLNRSGIGLVELDKHGKPIRISQLVDTSESISFEDD